MKQNTLIFIFSLFFLFHNIIGQENKQFFNDLVSKNDTLRQQQLLEKWEQSDNRVDEMCEDTMLTSKVENTKIGNRFYLKTEILNTALRAVFVKHTYDVDIQASFRLTNHLHIVNTYGKTTFYLENQQQSSESPNLFLANQRIGTSLHRSSSMLRYYPFNDMRIWCDYIFIEGGFHFQKYKGVTNSEIFDTTTATTLNYFSHYIDMYRYGPQINIGLSQYFQQEYDNELSRSKIFFSPEFFIGISYNQIQILRDELVNHIGTMVSTESYTEPKIRFNFRMKLGIGFL